MPAGPNLTRSAISVDTAQATSRNCQPLATCQRRETRQTRSITGRRQPGSAGRADWAHTGQAVSPGVGLSHVP